MKRIVAVPVDARPVVCSQVVELAALAGVELVVPPPTMLGHFREPADGVALREWLADQLPNADGVILSLDMMLYGGLVPSRIMDDTYEVLLDRLQRLALLRALPAWESLPWFVFAATMRISNNNVNEEEKLYWSEYGEAIWQWSYHTDRAAIEKDAESRVQAERAAALIPAHVRDDYQATRARNFAVTNGVLELVKSGAFDRLVLPQDDTAAYGCNIAERRALQTRVAQEQLAERVAIYAGADEVLHTLLARMVGAAGGEKRSLFVTFSDPTHVGSLTALYEDRPLLDSLAAQIDAVGASRTSSFDVADALVVVHTQGSVQGDWAMRKPLPNRTGADGRLWTLIEQARVRGLPVVLIDLAYANGGDLEFVNEFSRHMPINQIAAYAGWNTASNSIGGALAQAVLALSGAGEGAKATANQRVVCLRFLEDLVYQADVRQRVRSGIDEASLDADALCSEVTSAFVERAHAFMEAHDFPFKVRDVFLPWGRSFEIGISLEDA